MCGIQLEDSVERILSKIERHLEKTQLDDVDFLATYDALETQDPVNFYRYQYSQRVINGENVRANEAEDLEKYEGQNLQAEDIITDQDIEDARSKQLGVTLAEEDELTEIKNNEYFQKQFNQPMLLNEFYFSLTSQLNNIPPNEVAETKIFFFVCVFSSQMWFSVLCVFHSSADIELPL